MSPVHSRRLRRLGACFILVPALLWGGWEAAVCRAPLPPRLLLPTHQTAVLLDRQGRLIAELGDTTARAQFPVSLDAISPHVVSAMIALEDRRFRNHSGVDFQAVAIAGLRDLCHGRIVSGASTIAQQLIKNTSPPARRTWGVKISEMLAATRLSREWSRDAIMERYLNEIEFGNRLRGIEAASRAYFGCAAARLSPQQALFLAALPQAPSRYNPWSHPDAANARYQRAVRRLQGQGLIPAGEPVEWWQPPAVQPRHSRLSPAPHYVEAVRRRLPANAGTVGCTLDLDLQAKIDAIAAWHAQRLAPSNARHIAIVVMDHETGAVEAWHGSSGWMLKDGRIDGVTLPRSCGSTLKPFLYLQALDRRILTAATLLPDTPDAIRTEYVDYDPHNYDQRFWGPVRVREALANSLNVPAVIALSRVGARSAYGFIANAGIRLPRSLQDYGAGLILGNAEVRLLDMAAAYGVFANRGVLARPRLLQAEAQRHHAIASPQAADIIADILCDNDARRKTFGPFSPLAMDGVRIPCKTGTSSGFRDAWTFGVTGRHVVGVWVGNFSGRPMREVASITGPAPVWRDVMSLLLRTDGGVPAPVVSPGLLRTPVCSLTGLLPCADSPGQVNEYFLPGTQPTLAASTMLTGHGIVKLPPAFALWCASSHNYLGATIDDGAALRIVQPREQATFLIDSHLPRERQQIDLVAVGPSGQPIEWRMDEKVIARDAHHVFWPLSRGEHCLQLLSGASETSVKFHVE